jgi:hypothetical protein
MKQKVHKTAMGWTLAECFLHLYGNHHHGDLKHSYHWEDVTCKNCMKYKPKCYHCDNTENLKRCRDRGFDHMLCPDCLPITKRTTKGINAAFKTVTVAARPNEKS